MFVERKRTYQGGRSRSRLSVGVVYFASNVCCLVHCPNFINVDKTIFHLHLLARDTYICFPILQNSIIFRSTTVFGLWFYVRERGEMIFISSSLPSSVSYRLRAIVIVRRARGESWRSRRWSLTPRCIVVDTFLNEILHIYLLAQWPSVQRGSYSISYLRKEFLLATPKRQRFSQRSTPWRCLAEG